MLDNINKFRISLGFRPIVWKVVKCLGCGKEFESRDYPRQRMCVDCRYSDDAPGYSLPNVD